MRIDGSGQIISLTQCNKMYLNVKVLFARVMDEKGKGFLPHRVAGAIRSLKWRKKKRSVYSKGIIQ